MAEDPLTPREVNTIHKRIFEELKEIKTQVKLTNGKIKKITIALVLLGGIIIGLGVKNVVPILTLFL